MKEIFSLWLFISLWNASPVYDLDFGFRTIVLAPDLSWSSGSLQIYITAGKTTTYLLVASGGNLNLAGFEMLCSLLFEYESLKKIKKVNFLLTF